jgi:mannose-6-phosphate isomerase-like protein (cupin superfamily)
MSEKLAAATPEFDGMTEADLLTWVKQQNIPHTDSDQMQGHIAILWNGQSAVIGWMANQPVKGGYTTVSPHTVTRSEHMTILEGQVKVKIRRDGEEIVLAQPPYTFISGDTVIFSKPANPAEPGSTEEPGRCWYLTTYLEQETTEVPQGL